MRERQIFFVDFIIIKRNVVKRTHLTMEALKF